MAVVTFEDFIERCFQIAFGILIANGALLFILIADEPSGETCRLMSSLHVCALQIAQDSFTHLL